MAMAERQGSRWRVCVWLLALSAQATASSSSDTRLAKGNCIHTLTCQFEESTCGFRESVNWRRERGSSGFLQQYQYVDGTATDLVSPPLCNTAIDVRFSCAIITSNVTGVLAELHVLAGCDDDTGRTPYVVPANKELTSAWKNVSLTLQACPTGQSLSVVFRAAYALPGSVILLDNVRLEPNSEESCVHTVSCGFEENTCGFLESVNWKREHSSSGYYQRYRYVDGTATDLVSPPLCNTAIDVRFSCIIVTTNITGVPAELHVLVECDDDTERAPYVVKTKKELSPAWEKISVRLQACPVGQSPRVVFRAAFALPGSVIVLDNVQLQTADASTTQTMPTTAAIGSVRSSETTRTTQKSTARPFLTKRHTTHSMTSTFCRPEMTSTIPVVSALTRSSTIATTRMKIPFKVTSPTHRRLVTSSRLISTSSSRTASRSTHESSRFSSKQPSVLTSLLVTTSPRFSNNSAIPHLTTTRSDSPVSTSSPHAALNISVSPGITTSLRHFNTSEVPSREKTSSTKKLSVDASSTSTSSHLSSASPQTSVTFRHPRPMTSAQHHSISYYPASLTTSSLSSAVSLDNTQEDIFPTTSSKQNTNKHPESTLNSETDSITVAPQLGGSEDKKRVIIGVVVGVCGTVLAIVVLTVYIFRRAQLEARMGDREDLIKLKQRWNRAESVY